MIIRDNMLPTIAKELEKARDLRIICPFVSEHIIRKIEALFDFKHLQLITRFKLSDFASGVSQISALRFALEKGATIWGVRNVHAKTYIFDKRIAIISSANLTQGGVYNNYECGVVISDAGALVELSQYFDYLISLAVGPLSIQMCDSWEREIESSKAPSNSQPPMPDYGGYRKPENEGKSVYVKFFGQSTTRKDLQFKVREEVHRALCHYACGFSENKKPRKINGGDTIYMARMTQHPNGYAIFGRADAIQFVEKRDRATQQEIEERAWKAKFPIYLRVKNAAFLDGQLGDCIMLQDMVSELGYNSFPTTQRRHREGELDINPNRTMSQKPYVQLSEEAVNWLEPQFDRLLDQIGRIPDDFIQKLPQAQIR